MHNKHTIAAVLASTLTLFMLSISLPAAHAQDLSIGPISISNASSPPLPPVAENGVVYLALRNHEMKAERLVSASTPVANRVEFHTSVKSGSMMMMKKMQAVEVPAHGTVALEPGGMHIMLIGMKNPLQENTSFPLTLTFEHAGTVTVEVLVRSPGETNNGPVMNHGSSGNPMDSTMGHSPGGKHKH